MKPEQFIREFGLGKARDLLDQREKFIHIEKPTHFDTDLEIFIHEADFRTGKLDESDIDLSELKRLVKSIEIINQAGGYEVVKTAISNYRASGDIVTFSSLEKRLKDHESIYGGGDE